jgi:hypothetical protein
MAKKKSKIGTKFLNFVKIPKMYDKISKLPQFLKKIAVGSARAPTRFLMSENVPYWVYNQRSDSPISKNNYSFIWPESYYQPLKPGLAETVHKYQSPRQHWRSDMAALTCNQIFLFFYLAV